MRFMTISFSVLAFSATSALSGGGTVTSTEPAPATLTVEATAQIVADTMGMVPATTTTTENLQMAEETSAENPAKVIHVAPPAAPKTVEVAEVKVAEAPTGPLDPRETISQCTTCHGVNGIATIPTAPNIAGSSRQYLETQLKAFRSGKRENEVMSVIAEDLSNAEIKAAAKWYASLKVTVEVPE